MKPETAEKLAAWVWPLLVGQLIAAIAWGIQTHVRLAQIELILSKHGRSLDSLEDVRERIVRIETKIDAIYSDRRNGGKQE